jgi:hypothetical protein
MMPRAITRVLKIILGIFIAVIVIGAVGEGVQQLWNWLLPSLLGWRQITYWQAVGVLVLCRLLFGSWGGRGFHRSNYRRRMAERWESMTPEEREKLRAGVRGRCGHFGARAEATATEGAK